jgi:hypothetical protein
MRHRGLELLDLKEGQDFHYQLLSSDPYVSSLKVSLIDAKMQQL